MDGPLMEIKDLKNKLVAVLGYGKEGKAVTKYLMEHGVTPVLFDERPWEQWNEIEKLEIRKLGVSFIFGPDAFAELKGFDVAFRSPGIKILDIERSVPTRLAEGSEPRRIYRQSDGPINGHATYQRLIVTSQTKWFFEHCPAKIIGVTGTKGKGTTSSLIYEILKRSASTRLAEGSEPRRIYRQSDGPINGHATQEKVFLTGNIGKVQPFEILDGLKADDWVVYELSSFQLQDLNQSPHIGVILMVTSEHLDYHQDLQEYVQAKSAITRFQKAGDVAVINRDFENSVKIGEQGKGKKYYFSTKSEADCFVQDASIVSQISNSKFQISNLQLRGAHNLQNVCAAILAAEAAGVDHDAMKQAIIDFKGLEHRLEFVAEKHGIKYYNDSFSTTPETAIAAIKAFTEQEIVILGGSSKNSDFTELGNTIVSAKNIKALILIGQEANRIEQAITAAGGTLAKILLGAKDMKEIFEQITSVASAGDVVLLSPACASFDMFESYTDRGNQFKTAVSNIK